MNAIRLYQALTSAAGPLFDLVLSRRLQRGKEDLARLDERIGVAGQPRPQGRLFWVHAASVGESLAVLPLINALLDETPEAHVLLTSGTVSSARLLAGRLPARVVHQFVPVDRPQAWRRFLAHWQPEVLITVESELWPNMILETRAQGLKMALVNARMSERSYLRWRRFAGSARALLRTFELILAQSEADAVRFRDLGAPLVRTTGNLKRAAPPLEADAEALDRLRQVVGPRPCWLGASTHAGEEALLLEVHRAVRARLPEALLVLAPRHPDRGADILAAAEAAGFRALLRSAGQQPEAETAVYVADTLGELGLFYRLASLAFIGKSLAGSGGQNPLEAARLGCPPVYGPNMENFRDIAASLEAQGGAVRIADPDELQQVVVRLLGEPGALAALAERARQAARSEAGVLEASLRALRPLLRSLGRPGADAAA